MHPIRSLVIGSVVLTGCIAAAPAEVAPDPAVAAKVRQLSDGNSCSDRIAGVLTAYRIGAGQIADVSISSVTRRNGSSLDVQRQAWVKMATGGNVVLRFDPSLCRIATIYARDGAVLPAAG